MHEDLSTTGLIGSKTVLKQNMEMEKTVQKSRTDKLHEKELQGIEEGPKRKIHIDSFRTTHKKY